MTTNQKVAGSSPAERAQEMPANAGVLLLPVSRFWRGVGLSVGLLTLFLPEKQLPHESRCLLLELVRRLLVKLQGRGNIRMTHPAHGYPRVDPEQHEGGGVGSSKRMEFMSR